IWEGERLGVSKAAKTLQLDEAFDIQKASDEAQKRLQNVDALVWAFGIYTDWDARLIKWIGEINNQRGLPTIKQIVDPRPVLHEARKIKAREEVEVMRTAAQSSSSAHKRGMQCVTAGWHEYELSAEIEKEFKKRGAQWVAYNSIVAGGS